MARVYAVLGRADASLHHARRSLATCESNGLGDYRLAAAYEGVARAYLAAGDAAAVREWKDRATAALDAIEDADDREIVANDIATLP